MPFNYDIFNKSILYHKEQFMVSSEFGKVTFSLYEKGFETIEYKDIKLERVYDENSYINN